MKERTTVDENKARGAGEELDDQSLEQAAGGAAGLAKSTSSDNNSAAFRRHNLGLFTLDIGTTE